MIRRWILAAAAFVCVIMLLGSSAFSFFCQPRKALITDVMSSLYVGSVFHLFNDAAYAFLRSLKDPVGTTWFVILRSLKNSCMVFSSGLYSSLRRARMANLRRGSWWNSERRRLEFQRERRVLDLDLGREDEWMSGTHFTTSHS